jgi:hypothetical protein
MITRYLVSRSQTDVIGSFKFSLCEVVDGRLVYASMDELVADVDDIFTEMEIVNWNT